MSPAPIPFQWEEPPADSVKQSQRARASQEDRERVFGAIAAARANPGRWARWPQSYDTRAGAAMRAHNLRAGKMRGVAPDEFETLASRHDGETWIVHFRAIGGEA